MFWDIEKFIGTDAGFYDSSRKLFFPYESLLEQVTKIQSALSFKRKALIALFCDNSVVSIATYLATLRSGHAVLLANVSTDAMLQRHLLDIYQPEMILSTAPSFELPANYAPGPTSVEGLTLALHQNPSEAEIHADTAVLMSTSGTTGSPKLIRLSYRNIQANAESIAACLGITSDERAITSLPISYAYGLSIINSHLLSGATLICTDASIVSAEFWPLFKEQQCTSLAGVPFSYMMLERMRLEKMNLPSLCTLTQAGGRLAPDKVRSFAEMAQRKNIRFFVMYGQTEATARITCVPYERLLDKIGSVGLAVPGGTLRIRDNGVEIKEPHVEGEVIYEGSNVMLGYAETRACLAKGDEMRGTLPTGDLGYKDAEGYLYITGRLKRFLKVLGLRLNLDEIEKMLEAHFSLPVACFGNDDHLHLIVESESAALAAEARQKVISLYKLHPTAVHEHHAAMLPVMASGKRDYAKMRSEFVPA